MQGPSETKAKPVLQNRSSVPMSKCRKCGRTTQLTRSGEGSSISSSFLGLLGFSHVRCGNCGALFYAFASSAVAPAEFPSPDGQQIPPGESDNSDFSNLLEKIGRAEQELGLSSAVGEQEGAPAAQEDVEDLLFELHRAADEPSEEPPRPEWELDPRPRDSASESSTETAEQVAGETVEDTLRAVPQEQDGVRREESAGNLGAEVIAGATLESAGEAAAEFDAETLGVVREEPAEEEHEESAGGPSEEEAVVARSADASRVAEEVAGPASPSEAEALKGDSGDAAPLNAVLEPLVFEFLPARAEILQRATGAAMDGTAVEPKMKPIDRDAESISALSVGQGETSEREEIAARSEGPSAVEAGRAADTPPEMGGSAAKEVLFPLPGPQETRARLKNYDRLSLLPKKKRRDAE